MLSSIYLSNFRNLKNKKQDFGNETTIIIGENASGKSNFLEAIYSLAVAKFERAVVQEEAISFGQDFARVKGILDSNTILEEIISSKGGPKKVYKVNEVIKSRANFVGNFYAVFFSPAHIRLVLGSPSRRRDSLDFINCQVNREYKKSLFCYNRILSQKNKLLSKKGRLASPSEISVWNEKLLKEGTILQDFRSDFFVSINKHLSKIAPLINSKSETLELRYLKSEFNEVAQKKALDKEMFLGYTVIGPHRDDYVFLKNGLNLAYFGSRGEQRTAVLATRLAEVYFILEKTLKHPTVLLDDVFSELDSLHRNKVVNVLEGSQVIITTAEKNLIPENIKANLIYFS